MVRLIPKNVNYNKYSSCNHRGLRIKQIFSITKEETRTSVINRPPKQVDFLKSMEGHKVISFLAFPLLHMRGQVKYREEKKHDIMCGSPLPPQTKPCFCKQSESASSETHRDINQAIVISSLNTSLYTRSHHP